MRFAPLGLFFASLASCSGSELSAPSGAGASSRFLAVDLATLPACGAAASMPVRGRIPALGPLAELADGALLELDASVVAAFYGDDEVAPVHRITERSFRDQLDVVRLPKPIHAWSTRDGFPPIELDAALSFGLVKKDACAARLADRCKRELPEIDGHCAQLDEIDDIVIAEAGAGLGFMMPLDENRVLISSVPFRDEDDGSVVPAALYVTDATRITTSRINSPVNVAHLAAFRRDAGSTIYLYGPSGTVAEGTPQLAFQTTRPPVLLTNALNAWLDGPRDDRVPAELFALDDSGAIEHFDGTRWRTLLDPGPARSFLGHGGIAWIAPGEAIAVGSLQSQIIRHHDGALYIEDLPTGAADRPSSVAVIPNVGTVVGTDRGALYLDRGGSWELMESPLDGKGVVGIVPFLDGFIFGRVNTGGTEGEIAQWTPGHGLCDSVPITARNVQRLAPIKDGFIVYSKDAPTNAFVGFVRRKQAYASCDGPEAPPD